MSNPETEATPAERMAQFLSATGARVEWEFVPVSKSRNAKPAKPSKDSPRWRPSLNWRYSIFADGSLARPVISGDYMQGCGHCPASKASVADVGSHGSIMREGYIADECETGKRYRRFGPQGTINPPSDVDLFGSLALDASAIDCPTFEDWAEEYGYDADSRKGEEIYRACLEIGLKLRAWLGSERFETLRTLAG